jgi:hypothetical protein
MLIISAVSSRSTFLVALGALVVSMRAIGHKIRGFKPGVR